MQASCREDIETRSRVLFGDNVVDWRYHRPIVARPLEEADLPGCTLTTGGQLMSSRMLVTGGAGFIGSHLVDALLAAGCTVRVLDNLSTGCRQNLEEFGGDVELVVGDIRDRDMLDRCCRNIDTVFHLAAFISVPGSVEDPEAADSVNITGTLQTLLSARDSGVRRVVFSSSAAVYGEPRELPVVETAPTRPASPYGLEKLYGEHICRLFHELYGLETVALRYFNVYGPRQSPSSAYAAVIPKFLDAANAGVAATVFGDGSQTRDFLYAADIAQANILASRADKAAGQTINIASGSPVSVLELHQRISRTCGVDIPPIFAAQRPGDIHSSVADTTLARTALRFVPQIDMDTGLKRTDAWFKGRGQ